MFSQDLPTGTDGKVNSLKAMAEQALSSGHAFPSSQSQTLSSSRAVSSDIMITPFTIETSTVLSSIADDRRGKFQGNDT